MALGVYQYYWWSQQGSVCHQVSQSHCEILGSYLHQHHQHHILRPNLHAESQSQAKGKKVEGLSSPNSASKLIASGVTDITALLFRARQTRVIGVILMFNLVLLLWRRFVIIHIIMWDHWLWLCVSEAVRFKCGFPLEPKPFPGLTVKQKSQYFHDTSMTAGLYHFLPGAKRRHCLCYQSWAGRLCLISENVSHIKLDQGTPLSFHLSKQLVGDIYLLTASV